MADETYTFQINLQVLEHLGIGLYSNTPSVTSELVANAYDADASQVAIRIGSEIVVEDNGHGMDIKDANAKFLTVGYRKRAVEADGTLPELITPHFKRKPMGRKGIGKLSVFAIADEVDVFSIKRDLDGNKLGEAAFRMTSDEIRKHAKEKTTYHPKALEIPADLERGTRLVLRNLKISRRVSEGHLRRNLARRFSILGKDFEVLIDGKTIEVEDRGYWDKLQFVWKIGEEVYDSPVDRHAQLSGSLKSTTKNGHVLRGWIGTVSLPKQLNIDDVDNNGIVILSRGKVVHENLLPFARSAKIFAEYVVGELEGDWLDSDDAPDMATSDRQGLQEDDPRFAELCEFLQKRLGEIADKWSIWRRKKGLESAVKEHPILQQWLDSLKSADNRKQAEQLISTVQGMAITDVDERREILKQTVVAFETLALRGNVQALSKLDSVTLEQFQEIFQGLDDLEAAHYFDISKGRFEILNTLDKLVEEDAKEREIQTHIFKHLWLLSPAWERAAFVDEKEEKRFLTALEAKKLGLSKNKNLSRFDIKYLTYSGKHVVLELKRSGRSLSKVEIFDQTTKYRDILVALNSGTQTKAPEIEINYIVGKVPTDYDELFAEQLRRANTYIYTYKELIDRTKKSYKDYLERAREVERIQKMLEEI